MEIVEVKFNRDAALNGLYIDPEPVLEPGAPVIVVHRGDVVVGAWEEDCFMHPVNQTELAKEATELLISRFPNIDLQTQSLRVFTCPQTLADHYDWDWTKHADAE